MKSILSSPKYHFQLIMFPSGIGHSVFRGNLVYFWNALRWWVGKFQSLIFEKPDNQGPYGRYLLIRRNVVVTFLFLENGSPGLRYIVGNNRFYERLGASMGTDSSYCLFIEKVGDGVWLFRLHG